MKCLKTIEVTTRKHKRCGSDLLWLLQNESPVKILMLRIRPGSRKLSVKYNINIKAATDELQSRHFTNLLNSYELMCA